MGDTAIHNGRQYQRFIKYPSPVEDGTLRCIVCGQIDDEGRFDDGTKFHNPDLCPGCPEYSAARKEQTDG